MINRAQLWSPGQLDGPWGLWPLLLLLLLVWDKGAHVALGGPGQGTSGPGPTPPAAGQRLQASCLPRSPGNRSSTLGCPGGPRGTALGKVAGRGGLRRQQVMKRIYCLHYRLSRSQMVASINSVTFGWGQW